ncbi:Endonuclease/exonuclease/phosphatase [Piptocephalis cylindrospora]|uniref:Endonuclease/exonuclease/phosphatase n=1 Tax=Piptocephalis cylindrospora TaxID=1907219 RepID=A0A4P9Y303_9FUNG|nr:Endonuclease/exonuclease/phosphatase [Piptocephalis cylindrospora]|eukprot:RKP13173.1 Endonuclease/exonuclease/phosphatase [Piptocephalis cylindrospora]
MASESSSLQGKHVLLEELTAPLEESDTPPHTQPLSQTEKIRPEGARSTQVNILSTPLPEVAPESISLLTYNISLGPWCATRGGEGRWKGKRLEEWIRQGEMGRQDIVCLQGVFSQGSKRQRKLIDAAREQGLPYAMFMPRQSPLQGRVDGGLIILSRYPILTSSVYIYNRGQHRDKWVGKGAMYVRLALSSRQRLHIFNTHNQGSPRLPCPMGDPAKAERVRQWRRLRRFMDVCLGDVDEQEPIVLTGQLNADAREEAAGQEYARMLQILSEGSDPRSLDEVTLLSRSDNPPRPNESWAVRDLALQVLGTHPILFGPVDGSGRAVRNPLVPSVYERSCACPSYTLSISRPVHEGEAHVMEEREVHLERVQAQVRPFPVTGQPFPYISGKRTWMVTLWLYAIKKYTGIFTKNTSTLF